MRLGGIQTSKMPNINLAGGYVDGQRLWIRDRIEQIHTSEHLGPLLVLPTKHRSSTGQRWQEQKQKKAGRERERERAYICRVGNNIHEHDEEATNKKANTKSDKWNMLRSRTGHRKWTDETTQKDNGKFSDEDESSGDCWEKEKLIQEQTHSSLERQSSAQCLSWRFVVNVWSWTQSTGAH